MKQFTKKDLKDGDILILRNGQKVEYPEDSWVFGLSFHLLNDDLTNRGMMGKKCDVVRVLRNPKYEVAFERIELLDDTEKRYLTAVIKPFKRQIKYIQKVSTHCDEEFIDIEFKDENICLPYFKKDTMYKGMKADKKYTLKELGLED